MWREVLDVCPSRIRTVSSHGDTCNVSPVCELSDSNYRHLVVATFPMSSAPYCSSLRGECFRHFHAFGLLRYQLDFGALSYRLAVRNISISPCFC